jgi:hypothetical protein
MRTAFWLVAAPLYAAALLSGCTPNRIVDGWTYHVEIGLQTADTFRVWPGDSISLPGSARIWTVGFLDGPWRRERLNLSVLPAGRGKIAFTQATADTSDSLGRVEFMYLSGPQPLRTTFTLRAEGQRVAAQHDYWIEWAHGKSRPIPSLSLSRHHLTVHDSLRIYAWSRDDDGVAIVGSPVPVSATGGLLSSNVLLPVDHADSVSGWWYATDLGTFTITAGWENALRSDTVVVDSIPTPR